MDQSTHAEESKQTQANGVAVGLPVETCGRRCELAVSSIAHARRTLDDLLVEVQGLYIAAGGSDDDEERWDDDDDHPVRQVELDPAQCHQQWGKIRHMAIELLHHLRYAEQSAESAQFLHYRTIATGPSTAPAGPAATSAEAFGNRAETRENDVCSAPTSAKAEPAPRSPLPADCNQSATIALEKLQRVRFVLDELYRYLDDCDPRPLAADEEYISATQAMHAALVEIENIHNLTRDGAQEAAQ